MYNGWRLFGLVLPVLKATEHTLGIQMEHNLSIPNIQINA